MTIALTLQGPSDGLDLDVAVDLPPGITGVLGPPGSGKTTLLQAIAGLRRSQGDVTVDGTTFQGPGVRLPPEERRVGLVFDDLRLFSHLSVRRNVQFGARGPLNEVIALLRLEEILGRRIASLTPDEQRRVAVARAVAMRPRLLAIDGGLTSPTGVVPWLRDVVRETGVPTLLTSTAVTDLLPFTDRLLLLDEGRMVAQGRLPQLVSDPATLARLNRQGLANVWRVSGVRSDRGTLWARAGDVELCLPEAPGPHVRHVALRPSDVLLATGPLLSSTARNVLPGSIRDVTVLPDRAVLQIDVGIPLLAEVTPSAIVDLTLRIGHAVTAMIQPGAFRWL